MRSAPSPGATPSSVRHAVADEEAESRSRYWSAVTHPALYTNRKEPLPCRRGATVLECGDWSPLLRRRLVAVELPCGSGHAGTPALARAMNAPSHLHACRSLTATSRLEKAVTSHRTPPSRSFDCGSPSSATVARSPRLPLTVTWRPFTCCCGDPYKEQDLPPLSRGDLPPSIRRPPPPHLPPCPTRPATAITGQLKTNPTESRKPNPP